MNENNLLNLLPELLQLESSIFQNETENNGSESSLNYSLIDYLKYEYPTRADSTKKLLEFHKVQKILSQIDFKNKNDKTSLDIGCATCRYPLFFAKQGFSAAGYDINDNAVAISRIRAKDNPQISIKKNNVLKITPELNTYDVITCMMGTFDHIKEQLKLLDWVAKSLKSKGTLIISFWNPKCPYTNYLNFYTRDERELIQNNNRDSSINKCLLEKSGLLVYKLDYFCYLPDSCYEAWIDLKESDLIEIDLSLSKKLDDSNSQMYIIAATKP
ncbi:MAG: class I SAM-dependent methyltransferase [Prochloraceae cyanobacterium]